MQNRKEGKKFYYQDETFFFFFFGNKLLFSYTHDIYIHICKKQIIVHVPHLTPYNMQLIKVKILSEYHQQANGKKQAVKYICHVTNRVFWETNQVGTNVPINPNKRPRICVFLLLCTLFSSNT